MGLIWHFGYRNLPVVFIGGGLVALLALASIYGVVRETLSYDGAVLEFGIEEEDKIYKSEWLDFGIFPLKTVIEAPSIDKRWGETYATAITNCIAKNHFLFVEYKSIKGLHNGFITQGR